MEAFALGQYSQRTRYGLFLFIKLPRRRSFTRPRPLASWAPGLPAQITLLLHWAEEQNTALL